MNDFELLGADQSLEDYPQDVVKSLGKALEAAKLRRAEMAAHGEPEESEGKGGRRGGGKGKGKKAWRPEDPETACGDCPYAWPGINVHWREKHRDESVWDEEGEFKAEVWEVGVEVAERILAALVEHGLGTRDRGMMSLDDLIEDGRVFCVCGDPGMAAPDNGLNWVALVKHVFGHLNENARRTLTPPARLESEQEESPVWIDDHELASCIKYLPRGADTSQAVLRVHAEPDIRARIDTCLSQCPEKSRQVCCFCDALTLDEKKDFTLFLPDDADAVLYHMQAKHGQDFQEKNVVFREESAVELEKL
ncbi:hypothetical protein LXA43DRAFT_1022338 [Ganoderma leucocontextum]|nr:hypothetical protein LXA43DRAFT_1022338 [Ganoderma leucocontextum]